jgi:hypothetical protein
MLAVYIVIMSAGPANLPKDVLKLIAQTLDPADLNALEQVSREARSVARKEKVSRAEQRVRQLLATIDAGPYQYNTVEQLKQALTDLRQANALVAGGRINAGSAIWFPSKIRFTRGTGVRVGPTQTSVQTTDVPSSYINCSMCTLAAIARRITGSEHWNSTTVAQSIREPEGSRDGLETINSWGRFRTKGGNSKLAVVAAADAQERQNQVEGMLIWCLTIPGIRRYKLFGTVVSPCSHSTAMSQMRRCPDGTLFAVLVIQNSSAHWICAEKVLGKLEFVDYQTQRVELPDSRPTFSDGPLLPEGKAAGNECQIVAIGLFPNDLELGNLTDVISAPQNVGRH